MVQAYEPNEVVVSVIMITYNQEKYVQRAIESILCQETQFYFEVLVGDDCSNDNTANILRDYKQKYPDKIHLEAREENLGANWNSYHLAKRSKGKYLAYLEGDDYWLGKDRLQNMVDFLERNPFYAGVSSRRERRDIHGNLLGYDPDERLLNKEFTVKDFLNGKRFSYTGTVMKNFYLNSGNKYEAVCRASRNVGDYFLCMILLDIGDVYILEKAYFVYTVSTTQGSNYNSMTNYVDSYYDHINMMRAVASFFEGRYNFIKEFTQRQFDMLLFSLKRFKRVEFKKMCGTIRFSEWIYIMLTLPAKLIKRVKLKIKTAKCK